MEVLRINHMDARAPTEDSLDSYPDQPLDLVPVDIIDNMVAEVAGRLLDGAETGGAGSFSLQN